MRTRIHSDITQRQLLRVETRNEQRGNRASPTPILPALWRIPSLRMESIPTFKRAVECEELAQGRAGGEVQSWNISGVPLPGHLMPRLLPVDRREDGVG